MKKVGDIVIYRRDVCRIVEIKKIRDLDYYTLIPISDESLKLNVPVSNKSGLLRDLISKEEVFKIINNIPNINIIEINDKILENEYKKLINSNNHEDLIKIIKTTYLRNLERTNKHKKIGDKDNYYFEKAESYLYNEFSFVLNMSYEETKKYVIEKVSEIVWERV